MKIWSSNDLFRQVKHLAVPESMYSRLCVMEDTTVGMVTLSNCLYAKKKHRTNDFGYPGVSTMYAPYQALSHFQYGSPIFNLFILVLFFRTFVSIVMKIREIVCFCFSLTKPFCVLNKSQNRKWNNIAKKFDKIIF